MENCQSKQRRCNRIPNHNLQFIGDQCDVSNYDNSIAYIVFKDVPAMHFMYEGVVGQHALNMQIKMIHQINSIFKG